MKINKVFCLFEQSGTFKREFASFGVPAEDYDIANDFGETDHVTDLFEQIRGGYNGDPSLFDEVTPDDLIVAFFPCTRFESVIPTQFRGENIQQKKWSDVRKIEYAMKLHRELHELYILVAELMAIALKRGIRMIVENPYTQPHYLTQYYPLKPSVIDKDRTERGDYYKKPTQYWFLNCKPERNLVFESLEWVPIKTINGAKRGEGYDIKVERSMIHPQYANRFIREFILDEEKWRK